METGTRDRQNPELPWYTICIALYSRGNGTFNWAIVVPLNSYEAAKFHATNRGSIEDKFSVPLRLKSVDETLIASENACVILKIGNVGEQTVGSLSAIFRDVPMENIPSEADEPFSAMTWVRQAVRALHRHGIINCPDAKKLEEEAIGYATDHDEKTILGMAGYKIIQSTCSF